MLPETIRCWGSKKRIARNAASLYILLCEG
jgi:hypothetical protein